MKLLFVCLANVMRSQIAQAFYNAMTGTDEAASAGVAVGDSEGQPLDDSVVHVMREVGIDVSARTRKQLNPNVLDTYDNIVVMLDDEVPAYLRNRRHVMFWKVPDPGGQSVQFHRDTRNRIRKLIEQELLR